MDSCFSNDVSFPNLPTTTPAPCSSGLELVHLLGDLDCFAMFDDFSSNVPDLVGDGVPAFAGASPSIDVVPDVGAFLPDAEEDEDYAEVDPAAFEEDDEDGTDGMDMDWEAATVTKPSALVRPKSGPGSRRKVVEAIRDELDVVIYGLFPVDKLKLSRTDFAAWKKTSGVRKLSVPEQKRLALIRRTMLARTYAERTRLRKIEESQTNGSTLEVLKAKNTQLRKRTAHLEAVNKKLMEKIKRMSALGQLKM